MSALKALADDILQRLNAGLPNPGPARLSVVSPIDGGQIALIGADSPDQASARILQSHNAWLSWRTVPAPRRGELIRLLGEELRISKEDLGTLVSIETGKTRTEGLGEVQEMIDICDLAVGLSRQLYGLTIASERPGHRMMETWHPMGVVGVISAFNFPVAVWAWNATIALVCGNSVIWKPSEKTPLSALACMALLDRALQRFGADAPSGLCSIAIGGTDIGEVLTDHPLVRVLSATGSTRMGREVGPRLARRFARPILELGGNNAGIITPSADLSLAVRAVAFSAMGTAGQRCTTMRRLFLHDEVYDTVISALKAAYESVRIGDPLDSETLIGPLIDRRAFLSMQEALTLSRQQGGRITGGERVDLLGKESFYVRPALVELDAHAGISLEETFAPILYVFRYSRLEDAIRLQNSVGAGLSSTIFTNDVRESEHFLSAAGSDCGIVNVNIGTSGAEIGGAFGGEKETGGGRESGSDAWKAYMRRATNTINYSESLPLAQGVRFLV